MAIQDRLRDYRTAGRLSPSRRARIYRVMPGFGGWAGAIVAGNLDSKDPTAALGFVGAVPDLKQKTTPGGTLYVFALPPS
jgi:hypothetical protein